MSRKLCAISDHHTADNDQVLTTAMARLGQGARMAGAQTIEPPGKSIGFLREHGLDEPIRAGCPLFVTCFAEAALDARAGCP